MEYLTKRELQALPHERLLALCLQQRDVLEEEQKNSTKLQSQLRKLQARLEEVEEDLEGAQEELRNLDKDQKMTTAPHTVYSSEGEGQSDNDLAPPGFTGLKTMDRNEHASTDDDTPMPRMPARLLPASLQSRLSFPNGQPPRSEPAEGGTAPPGFGSVVAPKQGSLSPLRALPQYRPQQRPMEPAPFPSAPGRASDIWTREPGSRSSADRWTHDQFDAPQRRADWPQAQAPFRPAVPSLPPASSSQSHPSHQPAHQSQGSPVPAPAPLAGMRPAGSGSLHEVPGTGPSSRLLAEQPNSRHGSPSPAANLSWADQAEQDLRGGLTDDLSFPALGQPAARQSGRQNGGPKLTDDLSSPALGQPAARQNGQNGHSSSGAEAPAGAWSNAQHLRAIGEGSAPPRPAAVSLGSAGEQRITEELQVGLRSPDDSTSDLDRRRQMQVRKNYELLADLRGRQLNFMEGLELYEGLLSPQEQALMIRNCLKWKQAGHEGRLRGRTFTAPRKSIRGKGRVTVQFGCCYNYATDRLGRAPGIIAEEVVEPLPDVLKSLVKRIINWGIVNPNICPDTAIVNFYDTDDCIPPHVDHKDFVRPFVTISLLSQQSIMFGPRLIPVNDGEFGGPPGTPTKSIPLPPGSCLVLKGNGADIAQHCVPAVSQPRISITLRKMGDAHAIKVLQETHRAQKLAW